ncbi:MAG TPA: O-antigen ligase family protein [Blastocatellia bacterium]|nr:O-antigen ligase family protein [Blastocatellia bacterium]
MANLPLENRPVGCVHWSFEVKPVLINNVAFTPAEAPNQRLYLVTERIIQFCLVMYALFAPHSIAITQGSYLLGALAWGVQLVATRNFKQLKTPADIALFGFFACCFASSIFSYNMLLSLNGLRSPAFFLAFYFVSSRTRTLRSAAFLAFALVGSCLINVAYSGARLAIGQGVKIDAIASTSPLADSDLQTGDVILAVDNHKVKNAQDISQIVDSSRGRVSIDFQRKETLSSTSVSRKAIKESPGAGTERLGIVTSPGRNFRITGFYNHYETYAEVLSLIASLAIGLLIAVPRKASLTALFLGISALLITAALILTSTRSGMLALGASLLVMTLASYRRRAALLALALIAIVAPIASFELQRSRGISFLDPQEGSTAYRLEVWREALGLIKNDPVVGIGKGSEGSLKESLGLFDNGKLPASHFHSTPIQIATWWGLAALICYMSFMVVLVVETWRTAAAAHVRNHRASWGIALGVLGALIAFNVNSLAQFNFGDGEVVMAFWLLAGISFAVRRLEKEPRSDSTSANKVQGPESNTSDRNRFPEPEIASESTGQAAAVTQRSP